MKRKFGFAVRKSALRKAVLAVPLLLIAAVGLGGCFRGHGHGWGGHAYRSPERMEEHIRSIEEDLAEDLNIRPEQREAYQALTERYKTVARNWVGAIRHTSPELKETMEQDAPDVDRIAELLKGYVRQRPSNDELEALIDESVAFYKTLSPDQQQVIQDKISRHLKGRFGWHS